MMSVAELKKAAKRIHFADWEFKIYETEYESPRIHIVSSSLLESYDKARRRTLGVRCFIPQPVMRKPKDFYRWLEWRIERIASHEVREMFEVDGKKIFDPHRKEKSGDSGKRRRHKT